MSSEAAPTPALSAAERTLYPGALRLFLALLFTLLVAAPAFRWFGIPLADFSGYMETVGFDGINMAGLTGVFVLFLCARPGRAVIGAMTGLALLIEVALFPLRPDWMGTLDRLNLIGLGPSLGGVLGLTWLAFRASGRQRERAVGLLAVGGVLMLYGGLSAILMSFLSFCTPQVGDAFIYRLEWTLGYPPPVLVARFLEQNAWLDLLVSGVYLRLTLFIAIALYLNLAYPKQTTGDLVMAFLLALILCMPMFLILPMVGIDDYLGQPPWPMGEPPREFRVDWVSAPPWLPRTCAPSLHSTWIFLFYFSMSRRGIRATALAAAVVVLTLLGTLSTPVGHYFVDLVLALPLAVAVSAWSTFPTASNGRLRWRLVGAGLAVTLVSMLSLRFAPDLVYRGAAVFWLLQALGSVLLVRDEARLGRQTMADLAAETAVERGDR